MLDTRDHDFFFDAADLLGALPGPGGFHGLQDARAINATTTTNVTVISLLLGLRAPIRRFAALWASCSRSPGCAGVDRNLSNRDEQFLDPLARTNNKVTLDGGHHRSLTRIAYRTSPMAWLNSSVQDEDEGFYF